MVTVILGMSKRLIHRKIDLLITMILFEIAPRHNHRMYLLKQKIIIT